MGLIERILEKVLAEHAGEFLKVNREQLRASLLRGEVVLNGVELRVDEGPVREAMRMLPFAIKSCRVGTLKAKIPWNELGSKSVRVYVSGVEVVLVPQTIDQGEAGDSWADVVKRQRLKAAEVLLNEILDGEAQQQAAHGKKKSTTAAGGGAPPAAIANPTAGGLPGGKSAVASTALGGGGGEDEDEDLGEDGEEEEDESEDGQVSAGALPSSASSSSATSAQTIATALQQQNRPAPPPKKKSRMSLLQRVVARILDNLAITVEHLHVRYEDELDATTSAPRFCLGLTIDEVGLFTVSDGPEQHQDEPAFVDRTVRPPPALLKRRLKVKGLSLYWERTEAGRQPRRRRDIIHPFGVAMTVSQHLVANPVFTASVEASTQGNVQLSLGPDEYRDLATVVERATAHDDYVTRNAILKLRPALSPRDDPLGWWRYAIRAVQTALKETTADESAATHETGATTPTSAGTTAARRKTRLTWMRIMGLIQQRWKYVLLYKRRLIHADAKFQARARKHSAPGANELISSSTHGEDGGGSLLKIGSMSVKGELESAQEEIVANALLNELELELPFRTIMLFRAFAEAEFREERTRLKKYHKSKKMPARALAAMVAGRKMVLRSFSSLTSLSRKSHSTPPPPPSSYHGSSRSPQNPHATRIHGFRGRRHSVHDFRGHGHHRHASGLGDGGSTTTQRELDIGQPGETTPVRIRDRGCGHAVDARAHRDCHQLQGESPGYVRGDHVPGCA